MDHLPDISAWGIIAWSRSGGEGGKAEIPPFPNFPTYDMMVKIRCEGLSNHQVSAKPSHP
jgi:hypothetical protein